MTASCRISKQDTRLQCLNTELWDVLVHAFMLNDEQKFGPYFRLYPIYTRGISAVLTAWSYYV